MCFAIFLLPTELDNGVGTVHYLILLFKGAFLVL